MTESESVLNFSAAMKAESDLFQSRTKEWLREVLLGLEEVSSANQNGGKVDATKALVVKGFTVDILPESEGRSCPRDQPILKFRVEETETTNYLVVKILDDSEPQYGEDNFGIRELNFYTQKWAESRVQSQSLNLGIAKCFYGRYIKDDEDRGFEHRLTDSSAVAERTLLLDTMSTLVLQDVSVDGYGHTSKSSLSRDEVHSALRELAKIHALSWAYREFTGDDLRTTLNFCENFAEFLQTQIEEIQESYPQLSEFLTNRVADGPLLLEHLKPLMKNLELTLTGLFSQPEVAGAAILPMCLLHMDFWTQNLLFHDSRSPDGASGSLSTVILDWKNTMYGNPTNDIACLFTTSLSSNFRAVATNTLLEFYWNSFQETCEKLNVKVMATFTLESLQSSYAKSRILPLTLMMGSIGMQPDNGKAMDKFIEVLRECIEAQIV